MTTTRRSVLSMVAAAPAVALPAIALPACLEPDPFAALGAKWREVLAAIKAHESDDDSIWDEVDARLPPPEGLLPLPIDKEFGFAPPMLERTHYHNCDMSQFWGQFYHHSDIREEVDAEGRHSTIIPRGLPWPEKQKRAAEIVACFDEWSPRRQALADELGAGDAQDEFDDLCDDLNDIEREIAAVPVTSISEAIAKARLVAEILKQYEDDRTVGHQEEMAFDLIGDLAKLA